MEQKMKGLVLLQPERFEKVYGEEDRCYLDEKINFLAQPFLLEPPLSRYEKILSEVEVIFSSWGAPVLDKEFLDAAPRLKAFFYAAGSVRAIVREEFWERNISLSNAASMNAIPVAEFTLAQVILSLKQFWDFSRDLKSDKGWPMGGSLDKDWVPGCYRSVVGIIGLGAIGRLVVEKIKSVLDLQIIAYDPFVSSEEAAALGVELCSLEELFERSDVVSLHAPNIKETRRMIRGDHFRRMKEKATFLNTSRGLLVCEKEMIDVISERSDITVCLDVTYPEPPVSGSPLYELPNVILSPHIAGSMHQECHRMGRLMVEEFDRFEKGEPLQYQVTQSRFAQMA